MIAGVVGLVAVPSLAMARQGADDPAGHVRREDRQADRQEDKKVAAQVANTPAPTVANDNSP